MHVHPARAIANYSSSPSPTQQQHHHQQQQQQQPPPPPHHQLFMGACRKMQFSYNVDSGGREYHRVYDFDISRQHLGVDFIPFDSIALSLQHAESRFVAAFLILRQRDVIALINRSHQPSNVRHDDGRYYTHLNFAPFSVACPGLPLWACYNEIFTVRVVVAEKTGTNFFLTMIGEMQPPHQQRQQITAPMPLPILWNGAAATLSSSQTGATPNGRLFAPTLFAWYPQSGGSANIVDKNRRQQSSSSSSQQQQPQQQHYESPSSLYEQQQQQPFPTAATPQPRPSLFDFHSLPSPAAPAPAPTPISPSSSSLSLSSPIEYDPAAPYGNNDEEEMSRIHQRRRRSPSPPPPPIPMPRISTTAPTAATAAEEYDPSLPGGGVGGGGGGGIFGDDEWFSSGGLFDK